MASWAFPLGKYIRGGAGLLQADELPMSACPHQQSSRPWVGGGCLLSNTTLNAHIFARKLFLSLLKTGHTHTHTHTDQINALNCTHSVNERGPISWSCSLPVGVLVNWGFNENRLREAFYNKSHMQSKSKPETLIIAKLAKCTFLSESSNKPKVHSFH